MKKLLLTAALLTGFASGAGCIIVTDDECVWDTDCPLNNYCNENYLCIGGCDPFALDPDANCDPEAYCDTDVASDTYSECISKVVY